MRAVLHYSWLLVPLHVKSHYSLGLGTLSISSIVEGAVSRASRAIALTDLENLYGQVEFHAACRQAGIRPLTGIELRRGFGRRGSHGVAAGRLVLLARDERGFSALCRIVTRRRATTEPTPEPLESIDVPPDGLIVMSDDPETVHHAAARFGSENARALIVRPRPRFDEAALIATARKSDVRLVADPDVVFSNATEHAVHALLVAIHRGERVSELSPEVFEPMERALPIGVDGSELYRDMTGAVEETTHIAEQCTLDLLSSQPVYPDLGSLRGRTALEELADRCRARLAALRTTGRAIPAEYDRRLTEELEQIGALGFAPYLLAVAEILTYARAARISVAGRGSAVGSLVAHLIGVSTVDPLEHGLYFERFMHTRRREPPDVDLDIASRRRDELIAWIQAQFGADRVAQVAALQTYGLRSAYREGLKALGAAPGDVDRFSRRMPADELLDAGRARVPTFLLPDRLRDAIPLIESLVKKPRYVSVHPGAVVIVDRPLCELAPLELAPKGICVTQFDLEAIRHRGLVKLDLLGNHCLDELDDTFESLAADPSQSPRPRSLDAIPLADPKTLAAIDRADTIGCFQIESPAVRNLLAKVPVRSLEDLVAVLAAVRPGAASGDAKAIFVRRARGEEPAEYLHPTLRPRLEATYGILLYEEDIVYVLATVGGLPRAEADELRGNIHRRQDDPVELEQLKQGFIARAMQRGYERSTLEKIWAEVLAFVAYSFNKAHATSYALLAYYAAYMKAHAPVDFGCALLNHHGGMYPMRVIASDLVRSGVVVRAPSVLSSDVRCTVETDSAGPFVRVGLGAVKYLSEKSRRRIFASRQRGSFADLADFVSRCRVSKRELTSLVLSGACDGVPPLDPRRYPFAHESALSAFAASTPEERSALLERAKTVDAKGEPNRIEHYRRLVRVFNELKFLEMHLSDHPLAVLRPEAEKMQAVATTDLARYTGKRVRFVGVTAATRRVPSRGGGVTQFMTLEDEHGLVEGVLFPDVYARVGRLVTTPGPYLVTARVEDDHGVVQLIIEDLLPFHLRHGSG